MKHNPARTAAQPNGTAIARCAELPRCSIRCPSAPSPSRTSAPTTHGTVVTAPTSPSDSPTTVPRYWGSQVVRKPCTQKFDAPPITAEMNARLSSARQILTGFCSSTAEVATSFASAAVSSVSSAGSSGDEAFLGR